MSRKASFGAFFGIAILTVAFSSRQLVAVPWGVPALCAAAALAWFVRRIMGGGDFQGRADTTAARDRYALIVGITLLGAALRFGYFLLVPPVQLSDFLDYLTIARRLAETGVYASQWLGHPMRAFRPPGYPLLLAAMVKIMGFRVWLPLALNLTAYLVTSGIIYRIISAAAGHAAATFGVILLALWPSEIMMAGMAATETVSMALLCGSVWVLVRTRQHYAWAVLLGVLSGAGALVRPSIMAIPAVWLAYVALLPKKSWPRMMGAIAVAGIAMILTILPWTIRNHSVLGAWVPVSSNGGLVFYAANCDTATGTYDSTAPDRLRAYPGGEVEWNRVGYQWGREWIRSHPGPFQQLMVQKLRYLVQADNTGAYWSLKRGRGYDGAWYQGAVALSNMWWLSLWLIVLTVPRNLLAALSANSTLALCVLTIVFFAACHMVFESQPRHHTPLAPLLIAVIACATVRRKKTPIAIEPLVEVCH